MDLFCLLLLFFMILKKIMINQNIYCLSSCVLRNEYRFHISLVCVLLCPEQEFDNADGEECSAGSSPVQEDSLSSCPSLPEVYTLPVRDRAACPALQDGAGGTRVLTRLYYPWGVAVFMFKKYLNM